MTPLPPRPADLPAREAPMATWPEGGDFISAILEHARELGPVFRLPAVRPTYVLNGTDGMRAMGDPECVERSPIALAPETLLLPFNEAIGSELMTDDEEHLRRLAAWSAPGGLDRAGVAAVFPQLERSVDDILRGWDQRGMFSLELEVQRAVWRLSTLLVMGSEAEGHRFPDVDTRSRSAQPADREAAKARILAWLDGAAAAFEKTGATADGACLGARLAASGKLSRAELVHELNRGLTASMFGAAPIAALLSGLSLDRALFTEVRAELQALGGDLSLECMHRIPRLLQLIEDALRITTPVPLLYAKAKTTFVIDGFRIPTGAIVLGAAHSTNQEASFQAFGVRPNTSPAAYLSTMLIWVFATRLIAAYDLRALDESDVPRRMAGGFFAPHGAFVRFRRGSLEDPAATGPRPPAIPWPPAQKAPGSAPFGPPHLDARIAIVGAGITGLTVAHELRKRGFRRVTVFERAPSVGGKADTVQIDGRPYNLGAHLCHGNLGVAALASDVGVAMERTTSYVLWDLETNRALPRRYQDLAEFNRLRRRLEAQPELASVPGFAAAEQETYPATDRWLAANDFGAFREVGPFFTGAGYGFLDEDVPAAFFLKFTQHMTDDGWTPAGGYKHLLERVAERMDVRCATEVTGIERTGAATAGIHITTGHGVPETFDRLVLTGPLEQTGGCLDLTAEESALFSRIKSDSYYTVLATLDIAAPHAPGLYIVPGNTASRGAGGHTTAFVRMYEDSKVYHFFCYGEPGQSDESILERVRADARKLGGELGEVHVFRKWAYAPRVPPHDMALGYHRRLDRMQGQLGTYYAGSLLAFELTDHNVLFAKDLVERFFHTAPLERLEDWTAPQALRPSPPALAGGEVDPLCRVPERGTQSILEILRERYERTPDSVFSTFLDTKGKVVRSLSYRELVERALACAVSLGEAGVQAGDRVALVYPPDTDEFLVGFFGCLFARAIAVPIASPDPRALDVEIPRFAHLMNDCDCRVALTTRLYYAAALAGRVWHRVTRGGGPQEARWPKLTWIRTDGLSPLAPTPRRTIPSPGPDTVAYLQYTSGSTSAPKGVTITHGNVLHNVEAIRRQAQMTSRSVLVGWVPLFHDMGLVGGPLNAIYSGSRMVFFSPMSFLQNPRLWVEAMHQYRATHTESPNFGYEYLLRHLEGDALEGLDLSCVTHALFGGEAMRHRTFERMAERLHKTGFRPEAMSNIFGAAEATLFLAGGGEGAPPLLSVATNSLQSARRAVPCRPDTFSTTQLLGCRIPDGCDLRIVDPESQRLLPDREVGEIWLSSPSVAQGYWGRTREENDAIFRARIAGDPAPLCTYLRTGDLGFIDRGVLYICGRHKEMMIFEGRNIYPMDIEVSVMNAHGAIRQGCVAAFSVEEEDQERLVIVAELKAQALGNAAAAASAIAVALGSQHHLSYKAVVLVLSGSLPKTSSGKLQRYRAREAYLSRELQVVYEQSEQAVALPPPATDVVVEAPDEEQIPPFAGEPVATRRWFQRLIASSLRIPPDEVSTSIPLTHFGVDSLHAMSMMAQITEYVGEELSPAVFFEHPTIDALVDYLCGAAAPANSVLVPLQPGDRDRSRILFCVHPVGGSAMAYVQLVKQLPDHVPVYAFDSDGSDVPCGNLVEMAARYVAEMQEVQPAGPYYLVGYSFGGTVAFEMAQQLLAAGLEVGGLFMIDAPAPLYEAGISEPQTQETEAFTRFLQAAMLNRIVSDELDDAAQAKLRERVELNHAALARYRIKPDERVLPEIKFFRAAEEAPNLRDHLRHPAFDAPDFGWRRASPGTGVHVVTVPGDHFSVMREPAHLAALLADAIAQP